MFKRHFFLIAAVALVALMLVAAGLRAVVAGGGEGAGPGGPGGPGGGRGGAGGGRAQQVEAVTLQPRTFTDGVQALGVAKGRRSLDITSATTELITLVMFVDGQRVAAGTPLVELQSGEEDANLLTARAELTQAEREVARWRELVERGVAPRVQLEQAETALATARAGVAAARARRGDRVIRAPFAGVIGLSDVTPGTLVNPGRVIATLDDISVIRVDFPVPERYLGRMRAGTPITAVADALPGETFSGSIALMDTRVDPATRAVTARAQFANPGGQIRPGMLVRVRVQQGERQGLAAPEAAVLFQADQAFVYRIVAEGEALQAQRVQVETGVVEGGFIEITGGLQPGDRIVASGLNRLQPGAPVRLGGGAPR